MSEETRITATEYDLEGELKPLLAGFIRETELSDIETEHHTVEGEAAEQKHFTVTYREFQLVGTETYSTLGVMASYNGHLGLAAALVLAHARQLGVPTLCYHDQLDGDDVLEAAGKDLTAEWYHPEAVRAGLPEMRMEHRAVAYEHTDVGLGTIEDYATVWLRAGETDE